MKSVFVWILVTAMPSVAPVYSLPTVSEVECNKIKSAMIAYEARQYSKCVRVTTIID